MLGCVSNIANQGKVGASIDQFGSKLLDQLIHCLPIIAGVPIEGGVIGHVVQHNRGETAAAQVQWIVEILFRRRLDERREEFDSL